MVIAASSQTLHCVTSWLGNYRILDKYNALAALMNLAYPHIPNMPVKEMGNGNKSERRFFFKATCWEEEQMREGKDPIPSSKWPQRKLLGWEPLFTLALIWNWFPLMKNSSVELCSVDKDGSCFLLMTSKCFLTATFTLTTKAHSSLFLGLFLSPYCFTFKGDTPSFIMSGLSCRVSYRYSFMS